jgi:hypothetical protein
MGIIRTGLAIGMLAASFYAGMTYEKMKPATFIERRASIEDKVRSLMNEDKETVLKALYKVGKDYGYEK